MAYNIFVNSAATSLKAATVASKTDMTYRGLPMLVIGNKPVFNLYLVDGNGAFDAISGSAGYTVHVGIGDSGAVPTGGTFTLTSGANTTTALAYNITAAALETALNLLASITGEGLIDVTGEDQVYTVTWRTVGAKGLLSGDPELLTPFSAVSVSQLVTGDGSTKEVQLVRLIQNPAAYQSSWSAIADGWSATLRLDLAEVYNYLAGLPSRVGTFQVDVIDPTGAIKTYCQQEITVFNTVIDPGSLASYSVDQGKGFLGDDGLYYPITVTVKNGVPILAIGPGVA